MPSSVSTSIVFISSIAVAVIVAGLILFVGYIWGHRPVPVVLPTPYCQGGQVKFQLQNQGTAPLDLSKVKINGVTVCGSNTLAPGETAICNYDAGDSCPTRLIVDVEGVGSFTITVTQTG